MSGQADYTATHEYLHSLRSKGSKYGIARIWALIAALEHPERSFPVIHVAGTNGKGSTCAMIEAIYRANGYKTGLYTSPHLVHESELIQASRNPVTENDIIRHNKQLKPIVAAMSAKDPGKHPSFFELMTAMAFMHFSEVGVDIALIETGLGGRLDATNVVEPELSIITSIGLDHTKQLGDTLEQIALEKAGIIKTGKPVLIGRLPEEAEAVIRQVAKEKACTVHSICERFPDVEKLPKTNLSGSFQRLNAAVAVYAAEILNRQFPVDSMKTHSALQTIDWPGRWQTLKIDDKTLILDVTHNPEGAKMLDENLKTLVQQTKRKPIIVVGTTGESRAHSLMPVVSRYARELCPVAPNHPDATPSQTLVKYLPDEIKAPVSHTKVETIFPAPETCAAGEPGDTIVVTGSIYLVGEVLKQLNGDVPS